jgi:hypothetical protein
MSNFSDILLQDVFVGAIVMVPSASYPTCYDYGVVSEMENLVFKVEMIPYDIIICNPGIDEILDNMIEESFVTSYNFFVVLPEILQHSYKKVPHDWKEFLLTRSLELLRRK